MDQGRTLWERVILEHRGGVRKKNYLARGRRGGFPGISAPVPEDAFPGPVLPAVRPRPVSLGRGPGFRPAMTVGRLPLAGKGRAVAFGAASTFRLPPSAFAFAFRGRDGGGRIGDRRPDAGVREREAFESWGNYRNKPLF